MTIYILILALQGMNIQGGVTTAEFTSLDRCTAALTAASSLGRAEGICVLK
jgi:hypothetical protein